MSTEPKIENRGGFRPNSGRKPEPLSAKQLRLVLREVRRRAKKEGKTIAGGLLDIFYDKDASPNFKISAAKLIWDKTFIQVAEGGEADRTLGPALYLPEMRPLELSVIHGGKKADDAAQPGKRA